MHNSEQANHWEPQTLRSHDEWFLWPNTCCIGNYVISLRHTLSSICWEILESHVTSLPFRDHVTVNLHSMPWAKKDGGYHQKASRFCHLLWVLWTLFLQICPWLHATPAVRKLRYTWETSNSYPGCLTIDKNRKKFHDLSHEHGIEVSDITKVQLISGLPEAEGQAIIQVHILGFLVLEIRKIRYIWASKAMRGWPQYLMVSFLEYSALSLLWHFVPS